MRKVICFLILRCISITSTIEVQSVRRHRDGLWRSADEVPRSKDGRPLAYIAENGHGSYPVAGTIWRLFGVINDYTSDTGTQFSSLFLWSYSENMILSFLQIWLEFGVKLYLVSLPVRISIFVLMSMYRRWLLKLSASFLVLRRRAFITGGHLRRPSSTEHGNLGCLIMPDVQSNCPPLQQGHGLNVIARRDWRRFSSSRPNLQPRQYSSICVWLIAYLVKYMTSKYDL